MKIRLLARNRAVILVLAMTLVASAADGKEKRKAKEDQPAGLAKILGEDTGKAKKAKPMPITGYEIIGAQNVSEQVVLLALESKIGKNFSQELVDRDVKALRNLGYFSTIIPQIMPYQNGVKIVYRVVENPYVKEIRITGNKVVTTEAILKALDVKTKAVLNVGQLQEAVRRVNKLYSDKGYAFCGVLGQDQFSINPQTQVLELRIAEPKLKEIHVTGNKKTKTKVVTREMEIKKGELVKAEAMKHSMRNIYNLGFFEDVKPPEPQLTLDKQFMTLDMEVKEQKTGSASFGGGYSSVNGVIGFLDVSESNFRGLGQTLRGRLQFGGEKSYILSFVEPWFQDRPISLGLSLFQTAIDRQEWYLGQLSGEFRENRTGESVTGGWRVGRDKRLSATFTNESIKLRGHQVSDATGAIIRSSHTALPQNFQFIDVDKDGTVKYDEQSLRLTWTNDSRDNQMNPKTGQRLSLTAGITGVFLEGPYGFYQYSGDYRAYHTFDELADGVTVAARMRAGHTSVVDGVKDLTGADTGDIPFVDQFAIGGGDTLRGYLDRFFVGKDFVLGNFEVRKQFTKMFGLAAFVDTGSAFGSKFNTVRSSLDLHSAYGVGLRLNTPIGPFRLDYGVPFDDTINGTKIDSSRWHFGIGQQF